MSVLIYTDGSAGGDGAGGWAAVMIWRSKQLELSGAEEETTNQRMELTAPIRALAKLKMAPVDVTIYSDSAYLVNCFREGWISRWRAREWTNSRGKPVANRELWETLEALVAIHRVEFRKVRGHSGHRMNERADWLAGKARRELWEAAA